MSMKLTQVGVIEDGHMSVLSTDIMGLYLTSSIVSHRDDVVENKITGHLRLLPFNPHHTL